MLATLMVVTPGTSEAKWNPWPGPIGGPCEVDLFDFPQGGTYMTSLGLGEYNFSGSLQWLNDDVESVYVPEGMSITVSEHYDGAGWTKYGVGPSVIEVHDDQISWIKVEGNCGTPLPKLAGPEGPECPADSYLWQNSIDLTKLQGSAGIPEVDVRLKSDGTTSFVLPNLPAILTGGPAIVEVTDVVSWDGYEARANTADQPNEQWFIAFLKDGNVIYATEYTQDLATGTAEAEWFGPLGVSTLLPEGADEVRIVHYNDPTWANGPTGSPNSVVPASVCIKITPPQLGDLGDTIWFDIDGNGVQDAIEPGIDGITVQLRQGGVVIDSAVTDTNGFYLFEDLPEGNYAVQLQANTVPFGLTQTYDADGNLDGRSVTFVPAGGADLDQDFGYELLLGTLGDTVWLDDNGDGVQDAGEVGIPGVTMLLRQNGVVVGSAITDDDGMYLFDQLIAGRYAVQVDKSTLPAAVAQTYDLDGVLNNRAAYTLAPGENNLGLDFGYEPQIGELGDTVWLDEDGNGVQDAGEAGIPGVTMLLRQGGVVVDTAVTDVDGMYLFTNLVEGNWAVQVRTSTLPNGLVQTFDDDGGLDNRSVTFVPGGGADLDQDFGYRALLGDLGDTVWYDADSDRTQNNGEVGIPDVTVLLRQGGVVIDSTMTDADGMYLFPDLAEGTYAVQIDTATLPDNLIQTHDDSGALDHRSATFVPGGGQDLDQDFGYVEPEPLGSIGDFVWFDRNESGGPDFDQQAGVEDEPLEGVVVSLLDAGGAVLATDMTDADGLYLFPDLPLGVAYTVVVDPATVTPPSAGLEPRQTYDLDGTLDHTSTVVLGTGGLNDDLRHDFAYTFDAD